MSNEVLLSVIIPCYNYFHLMGKALSSLEDQKNDELEVIVVDDCSTDNSYEQLLQYAKTSRLNIRVFKNKDNSGPGTSRNNGIQEAVGKYITFLDADDYFSDDFISAVMPVLKADVDCVIFDFNTVHADKVLSKETMIRKRGVEPGPINPRDALVYTRGGTWGKIYRMDIIQKYGVKFLTLKRSEDVPFTQCAIAHCERILYIDQPFYNYVQHEYSLIHNQNLLDPANAQMSFLYIKEKIGDLYPDETEALFALGYMYGTVLTNVQRMSRKDTLKYINESEKIYPDWIHNKYLADYPIHIKVVFGLIYLRSWMGLKLFSLLRDRWKKRGLETKNKKSS